MQLAPVFLEKTGIHSMNRGHSSRRNALELFITVWDPKLLPLPVRYSENPEYLFLFAQRNLNVRFVAKS